MTQENRIGIMLALGYSKKEIANITFKSYHTVNQQTRMIYQKTNSRNLADITRWVVTHITGIDVYLLLRNELTSNGFILS
jgi:DNA-binding CsgD family transcriptional regulator